MVHDIFVVSLSVGYSGVISTSVISTVAAGYVTKTSSIPIRLAPVVTNSFEIFIYLIFASSSLTVLYCHSFFESQVIVSFNVQKIPSVDA